MVVMILKHRSDGNTSLAETDQYWEAWHDARVLEFIIQSEYIPNI